MSSMRAEWYSQLGSFARGEIRAALFTTFDPPDTRFLVEQLLPTFLEIERDPSDEASGRACFFAELIEKLRRRPGRIVVVSSAAPSDEGAYPWLWRYVRRLTVGAKGKAVQHAKLWMVRARPSDAITARSTTCTRETVRATRRASRGPWLSVRRTPSVR